MTENWDLFRTFLAVLDDGTLSAAARRLDLTQPTVGRQVAALERSLGSQLFVRSPGGLVPTNAALDLVPHARAVAAAAAALMRRARNDGEALAGTVRISASEMIGIEVLPGILVDLRRRHPQLVVELSLSNDIVDLSRRDADIAVRMVEPRQKALVARRLGTVRIGLYAHRRYLRERGTPRTLDDLAGHTGIGFDREPPGLRELMVKHPALVRDVFHFRSDSDAAQAAAIRAGYGIGGMQVPLAERDRTLVRVLPDVAFDLPIGVAMHEDLRADRACRAAFDVIVAGLRDYLRGPQRRR